MGYLHCRESDADGQPAERVRVAGESVVLAFSYFCWPLSFPSLTMACVPRSQRTARGLIESGKQGMKGAKVLETAKGTVSLGHCGRLATTDGPDHLGHTIVLLSSLHMWKRIHA